LRGATTLLRSMLICAEVIGAIFLSNRWRGDSRGVRAA
jgi:hypothetical protein